MDIFGLLLFYLPQEAHRDSLGGGIEKREEVEINLFKVSSGMAYSSFQL